MPTTIAYAATSEFFEPIEAAIRAAGGEVTAPLRVSLKPGGYGCDAHVLIRREDSQFFETDWESRQPSRFGARCKAAATVLYRTGHSGRFRIRHEGGDLIIEPA
jgi:hypothetical protein